MAAAQAKAWSTSVLEKSASALNDVPAACAALDHVAKQEFDDEECTRFMKNILPGLITSICRSTFAPNAAELRPRALEFLGKVAEVATAWISGSSEWTAASKAATTLIRNSCRCYFGSPHTRITGITRDVMFGRKLLLMLARPKGVLESAASLLRSMKSDTPVEKMALKQAIICVSRMVKDVVSECSTEQQGSAPDASAATQGVYQALCSCVLALSDKDLRTFEYSALSSISERCEAAMVAAAGFEFPSKLIYTFRMQFAVKCTQSSLFSFRLKGIAEIVDLAAAAASKSDEGTDDAGQKHWLTKARYFGLVESANVFDELFGIRLQVEVVSRLGRFLEIYTVNGQWTRHTLWQVWSPLLTAHEADIKGIMNAISTILRHDTEGICYGWMIGFTRQVFLDGSTEPPPAAHTAEEDDKGQSDIASATADDSVQQSSAASRQPVPSLFTASGELQPYVQQLLRQLLLHPASKTKRIKPLIELSSELLLQAPRPRRSAQPAASSSAGSGDSGEGGPSLTGASSVFPPSALSAVRALDERELSCSHVYSFLRHSQMPLPLAFAMFPCEPCAGAKALQQHLISAVIHAVTSMRQSQDQGARHQLMLALCQAVKSVVTACAGALANEVRAVDACVMLWLLVSQTKLVKNLRGAMRLACKRNNLLEALVAPEIAPQTPAAACGVTVPFVTRALCANKLSAGVTSAELFCQPAGSESLSASWVGFTRPVLNALYESAAPQPGKSDTLLLLLASMLRSPAPHAGLLSGPVPPAKSTRGMLDARMTFYMIRNVFANLRGGSLAAVVAMRVALLAGNTQERPTAQLQLPEANTVYEDSVVDLVTTPSTPAAGVASADAAAASQQGGTKRSRSPPVGSATEQGAGKKQRSEGTSGASSGVAPDSAAANEPADEAPAPAAAPFFCVQTVPSLSNCGAVQASDEPTANVVLLREALLQLLQCALPALPEAMSTALALIPAGDNAALHGEAGMAQQQVSLALMAVHACEAATATSSKNKGRLSPEQLEKCVEAAAQSSASPVSIVKPKHFLKALLQSVLASQTTDAASALHRVQLRALVWLRRVLLHLRWCSERLATSAPAHARKQYLRQYQREVVGKGKGKALLGVKPTTDLPQGAQALALCDAVARPHALLRSAETVALTVAMDSDRVSAALGVTGPVTVRCSSSDTLQAVLWRLLRAQGLPLLPRVALRESAEFIKPFYITKRASNNQFVWVDGDPGRVVHLQAPLRLLGGGVVDRWQVDSSGTPIPNPGYHDAEAGPAPASLILSMGGSLRSMLRGGASPSGGGGPSPSKRPRALVDYDSDSGSDVALQHDGQPSGETVQRGEALRVNADVAGAASVQQRIALHAASMQLLLRVSRQAEHSTMLECTRPYADACPGLTAANAVQHNAQVVDGRDVGSCDNLYHAHASYGSGTPVHADLPGVRELLALQPSSAQQEDTGIDWLQYGKSSAGRWDVTVLRSAAANSTSDACAGLYAWRILQTCLPTADCVLDTVARMPAAKVSAALRSITPSTAPSTTSTLNLILAGGLPLLYALQALNVMLRPALDWPLPAVVTEGPRALRTRMLRDGVAGAVFGALGELNDTGAGTWTALAQETLMSLGQALLQSLPVLHEGAGDTVIDLAAPASDEQKPSTDGLTLELSALGATEVSVLVEHLWTAVLQGGQYTSPIKTSLVEFSQAGSTRAIGLNRTGRLQHQMGTARLLRQIMGQMLAAEVGDGAGVQSLSAGTLRALRHVAQRLLSAVLSPNEFVALPQQPDGVQGPSDEERYSAFYRSVAGGVADEMAFRKTLAVCITPLLASAPEAQDAFLEEAAATLRSVASDMQATAGKIIGHPAVHMFDTYSFSLLLDTAKQVKEQGPAGDSDGDADLADDRDEVIAHTNQHLSTIATHALRMLELAIRAAQSSTSGDSDASPAARSEADAAAREDSQATQSTQLADGLMRSPSKHIATSTRDTVETLLGFCSELTALSGVCVDGATAVPLMNALVTAVLRGNSHTPAVAQHHNTRVLTLSLISNLARCAGSQAAGSVPQVHGMAGELASAIELWLDESGLLRRDADGDADSNEGVAAALPAGDAAAALLASSVDQAAAAFKARTAFVMKKDSVVNVSDAVLAASMSQEGSSTYVGLVNQGATCYQNSLLQQLFMIPPLRVALLAARAPLHLGGHKWEEALLRLRETLVAMFGTLTVSHQHAYDPMDFVRACDNKPSGFLPLDSPVLFQNDANEFFGLLIDRLGQVFPGDPEAFAAEHARLAAAKAAEEASKPAAADKNAPSGTSDATIQDESGDGSDDEDEDSDEDLAAAPSQPLPPNLLDQCLGGSFVNQIIGQSCDYFSEREEAFSCVQLDVEGKPTLEQSLASFVAGEVLSGDNAYQLDSGEKVAVLKRIAMHRLPSVLVLQLKRFRLNFDTWNKEKVHDLLKFSTTLDMWPYTRAGLADQEHRDTPDKQPEHSGAVAGEPAVDLAGVPAVAAKDCKYELQGVLVHMGEANSGHYFSYIRERRTDAAGRRWMDPHVAKSRPSAGVPEGNLGLPVSPSTGWFCFNDESVMRCSDMSFLEQHCFGGYVQHNHRTVPNHTSAFMLFFDRVEAAACAGGSAVEQALQQRSAHPGHGVLMPEELCLELHRAEQTRFLYSLVLDPSLALALAAFAASLATQLRAATSEFGSSVDELAQALAKKGSRPAQALVLRVFDSGLRSGLLSAGDAALLLKQLPKSTAGRKKAEARVRECASGSWQPPAEAASRLVAVCVRHLCTVIAFTEPKSFPAEIEYAVGRGTPGQSPPAGAISALRSLVCLFEEATPAPAGAAAWAAATAPALRTLAALGALARCTVHTGMWASAMDSFAVHFPLRMTSDGGNVAVRCLVDLLHAGEQVTQLPALLSSAPSDEETGGPTVEHAVLSRATLPLVRASRTWQGLFPEAVPLPAAAACWPQGALSMDAGQDLIDAEPLLDSVAETAQLSVVSHAVTAFVTSAAALSDACGRLMRGGAAIALHMANSLTGVLSTTPVLATTAFRCGLAHWAVMGAWSARQRMKSYDCPWSARQLPPATLQLLAALVRPDLRQTLVSALGEQAGGPSAALEEADTTEPAASPASSGTGAESGTGSAGAGAGSDILWLCLPEAAADAVPDSMRVPLDTAGEPAADTVPAGAAKDWQTVPVSLSNVREVAAKLTKWAAGGSGDEESCADCLPDVSLVVYFLVAIEDVFADDPQKDTRMVKASQHICKIADELRKPQASQRARAALVKAAAYNIGRYIAQLLECSRRDEDHPSQDDSWAQQVTGHAADCMFDDSAADFLPPVPALDGEFRSTVQYLSGKTEEANGTVLDSCLSLLRPLLRCVRQRPPAAAPVPSNALPLDVRRRLSESETQLVAAKAVEKGEAYERAVRDAMLSQARRSEQRAVETLKYVKELSVSLSAQTGLQRELCSADREHLMREMREAALPAAEALVAQRRAAAAKLAAGDSTTSTPSPDGERGARVVATHFTAHATQAALAPFADLRLLARLLLGSREESHELVAATISAVVPYNVQQSLAIGRMLFSCVTQVSMVSTPWVLSFTNCDVSSRAFTAAARAFLTPLGDGLDSLRCEALLGACATLPSTAAPAGVPELSATRDVDVDGTLAQLAVRQAEARARATSAATKLHTLATTRLAGHRTDCAGLFAALSPGVHVANADAASPPHAVSLQNAQSSQTRALGVTVDARRAPVVDEVSQRDVQQALINSSAPGDWLSQFASCAFPGDIPANASAHTPDYEDPQRIPEEIENAAQWSQLTMTADFFLFSKLDGVQLSFTSALPALPPVWAPGNFASAELQAARKRFEARNNFDRGRGQVQVERLSMIKGAFPVLNGAPAAEVKAGVDALLLLQQLLAAKRHSAAAARWFSAMRPVIACMIRFALRRMHHAFVCILAHNRLVTLAEDRLRIATELLEAERSSASTTTRNSNAFTQMRPDVSAAESQLQASIVELKGQLRLLGEREWALSAQSVDAVWQEAQREFPHVFRAGMAAVLRRSLLLRRAALDSAVAVGKSSVLHAALSVLAAAREGVGATPANKHAVQTRELSRAVHRAMSAALPKDGVLPRVLQALSSMVTGEMHGESRDGIAELASSVSPGVSASEMRAVLEAVAPILQHRNNEATMLGTTDSLVAESNTWPVPCIAAEAAFDAFRKLRRDWPWSQPLPALWENYRPGLRTMAKQPPAGAAEGDGELPYLHLPSTLDGAKCADEIATASSSANPVGSPQRLAPLWRFRVFPIPQSVSGAVQPTWGGAVCSGTPQEYAALHIAVAHAAAHGSWHAAAAQLAADWSSLPRQEAVGYEDVLSSHLALDGCAFPCALQKLAHAHKLPTGAQGLLDVSAGATVQADGAALLCAQAAANMLDVGSIARLQSSDASAHVWQSARDDDCCHVALEPSRAGAGQVLKQVESHPVKWAEAFLAGPEAVLASLLQTPDEGGSESQAAPPTDAVTADDAVIDVTGDEASAVGGHKRPRADACVSDDEDALPRPTLQLPATAAGGRQHQQQSLAQFAKRKPKTLLDSVFTQSPSSEGFQDAPSMLGGSQATGWGPFGSGITPLQQADAALRQTRPGYSSGMQDDLDAHLDFNEERDRDSQDAHAGGTHSPCGTPRADSGSSRGSASGDASDELHPCLMKGIMGALQEVANSVKRLPSIEDVRMSQFAQRAVLYATEAEFDADEAATLLSTENVRGVLEANWEALVGMLSSNMAAQW